jgi:hypothetical protein
LNLWSWPCLNVVMGTNCSFKAYSHAKTWFRKKGGKNWVGDGSISPLVHPYARWWTRGWETNQTLTRTWLLTKHLLAPRVRVPVSGDSGSAWLHVESTTHADSTSPRVPGRTTSPPTRASAAPRQSRPAAAARCIAVAQTGNLLGVAAPCTSSRVAAWTGGSQWAAARIRWSSHHAPLAGCMPGYVSCCAAAHIGHDKALRSQAKPLTNMLTRMWKSREIRREEPSSLERLICVHHLV